MLYYLNGSYLSGYSTKDKKPFEELSLFMDAETDVLSYLTSQDDSAYIDVVNKTKNFLQGFYSDFGLELLSTLDFIAGNLSTNDEHAIIAQLEQWSKRKRTLFSDPKFISVAMKRLAENALLPASVVA
mgnify:FL=1